MQRSDRRSEREARRSRRVLIVEDQHLLRETLTELLRASDYDVVSAADGEEALAHLEGDGTAPDVIVLDLSLPRLSGWEVLSRIRQLDSGVPVLVLTGLADECGVSGETIVLRKPVRPAVLLDSLRQLIELAD